MANTYTQISIHAIFAVQGRENLIARSWSDQLHKYIAGITRTEGAIPLAVNGWKDHVHAFFGLQPSVSIADISTYAKENGTFLCSTLMPEASQPLAGGQSVATPPENVSFGLFLHPGRGASKKRIQICNQDTILPILRGFGTCAAPLLP